MKMNANLTTTEFDENFRINFNDNIVSDPEQYIRVVEKAYISHYDNTQY